MNLSMNDNAACVLLILLLGFPSALRAFAKVIEASRKPKVAEVVKLDKTTDEQ